MARIEQAIEVNVPVHAAYNQWTQFTEFPRFMEGIKEVRQVDDAHLHWRAEKDGHQIEWDTEITQQVPDKCIEWRTVAGHQTSGNVTFEQEQDDKTKIVFSMETPEDEHIAKLHTELDLLRFKNFIESQGKETGAWRGEIKEGQVRNAGNGKPDQSDGRSIGKEVGQTDNERQDAAKSAEREASPPQQQNGQARDKSNGDARSASSHNNGKSNQNEQAQQRQESPPQQRPQPDEDAQRQMRQQQANGAQDQQRSQGQEAKDRNKAGEQQVEGMENQLRGNGDMRKDQQQDQQQGQERSQERGQAQAQPKSQQSGQQQEGQQREKQGQEAVKIETHANEQSDQRTELMHQSDDKNQMQGQIGISDETQTWLPNLLHVWDEPLAMMRRMTHGMDQLFDRMVARPPFAGQMGGGQQWTPLVEIAHRDNKLFISTDLPGISKDDVRVEIHDNKLTIEGERKEETQQSLGPYRRTERTYGRFYREIPLPEGVDPNSAQATMRDGILDITVPVPPRGPRGRRLDIGSNRQ